MLSAKQFVVVVLIATAAYFWQTRIVRGPVYHSDKDLTGKTVLITGGNEGIGKASALLFATRGARVVIASRNLEKSQLARDDIIAGSGNSNVHAMRLDLGSLDDVRTFASEFKSNESRLDYLINNAGVFGARGESSSVSGYQQVFVVNHFGPFLLTNLLLDLMKSSDQPSRIVNVASEAHRFSWAYNLSLAQEECRSFFCDFQLYGLSKLANILYTRELQSRMRGSKVTTFSLHPGSIQSQLGQNTSVPHLLKRAANAVVRRFMRSPYYGAQTIMYCALDDTILNLGGGYFMDCAPSDVTAAGADPKHAEDLWKVSVKVTGE